MGWWVDEQKDNWMARLLGSDSRKKNDGRCNPRNKRAHTQQTHTDTHHTPHHEFGFRERLDSGEGVASIEGERVVHRQGDRCLERVDRETQRLRGRRKKRENRGGHVFVWCLGGCSGSIPLIPYFMQCTMFMYHYFKRFLVVLDFAKYRV